MQTKRNDHFIVAIHVTDRVRQAGLVQKKLTSFGTNIKTRIGLHEANGRAVSPNGIIILELIGAKSRCNQIAAALNRITGVEVKSLVFEH